MNTIKRTPLKENADVRTEGASVRANRSATQWLFNPYSVADTTNWAVSTGVGKLAIGSLTKVKNVTEKVTPNKSNKEGYSSTMEFAGRANPYVERERFAVNIANEITNTFPRRVHRIRTLEGIDDVKQVEAIQEILLGEDITVANIEGTDDPVPVLPAMLEKLRYNMREISKTNSPQKALLLAVGKELEQAIAENMKLAVEDLKTPQQEVSQGKKAGFDNNAKRNFLALGRTVPDTLKFQAATPLEAQRPVDDRIVGALEQIGRFFGEASKVQGEPDSTKEAVETDENASLAAEVNAMLGESLPVEVEAEFAPAPKIVTTKELSEKEVASAEKAEAKKAEKAQAEEAAREEKGATRCAAITGAGERCKKDAVEGKFCRIHDK